jgi:hypothetical protein
MMDRLGVLPSIWERSPRSPAQPPKAVRYAMRPHDLGHNPLIVMARVFEELR